MDKEPGNIYIGGLYVCNMKNLKYALDFKPGAISLGRDKDFPSTWDLEYQTDRIINNCSEDLKFKSSDIHNREFNCGSIPSKLAEKFKPAYGDKGNLIMTSGKTIVTDKSKIEKLIEDPVVLKRVKKLKYLVNFKTRKSPETLLKELKMKLILNESEDIEFDLIIKLSKNWKNK